MPADRDADTSLTLLERLQKNPDDPQAWTLFIERYQPRIRRWCLTWGLQDSDADDVAQDVLVKLFAALRKFQYDPIAQLPGLVEDGDPARLERLRRRPAQGPRPERPPDRHHRRLGRGPVGPRAADRRRL